MMADHAWDASCPVCCDPHGIVDELRAELDRQRALKPCLGECFLPDATSPESWAELVAQLRSETVDGLLVTLRGALPSTLWAIQIGETNDEGWYLELVDSADDVLRSWYGKAVEDVVRQALTYATTAGAEG